ncbi:hypothetical protein Tco_1367335 [Tanacetum coccineum]
MIFKNDRIAAIARDIMENKDSERRAHSQDDALKNAFDEHGSEEDRLLIYGQILRVIQLSDDQLCIKALEEFKPSVYGENYEEKWKCGGYPMRRDITSLRKGNELSKNLRLTKLHIMIGTNLQMMKRKHDVDAINTRCQMGGILEDVPEVNKNAAGVIIESFVNDVSNDAALDETMIHNRVNGKSVNHVTQPDGTVKHNDYIKSITNDQPNAQIDQKVEQNEEVVPKCFNPSSGSTFAIHEPKV